MKFDPIIISLLDSDLYKFNMDQVIFHKHTDLCGSVLFQMPQQGRRFHRGDGAGDQRPDRPSLYASLHQRGTRLPAFCRIPTG